MAVTLSGATLAQYPRFSLYNSPYRAHDRGCAVDLYPESGAPSPVAGRVIDVRRVSAPPKPYAADHDYLTLIDTGDVIARVLHVDPAVEPGDRVAVGDSLGELVRAGFFAPWVDNHIHLGFRPPEANPYRASGSLRIELGCGVEPLAWDGTGRVRAVGDTYVVLDEPTHPAPGEYFAGIGAGNAGTALDGGLPHYEGGGAFDGADGPLELAGARIGTAHSRDIQWDGIEVRANDEPITGLSLFAARGEFGAKLVHPGHEFTVGDAVRVTIRTSR